MLKKILRPGAARPGSGPAAAAAVSYKNPGEALQAYGQLKKSGKPVPAALSAQVGDLYRDTQKVAEAAELYIEAAQAYVADEAWLPASQMLRKAEKLAPLRALGRLVALQVALGQEEWAGAARTLEQLMAALPPTDGGTIDRVVQLVDLEAQAAPEVEMALATLLAHLGRPDRAEERLRVAQRRAAAHQRTALAQEIEARLDALRPAVEARVSMTGRLQLAPALTGLAAPEPTAPVCTPGAPLSATPAPEMNAPVVSPPVTSAPVAPAPAMTGSAVPAPALPAPALPAPALPAPDMPVTPVPAVPAPGPAISAPAAPAPALPMAPLPPLPAAVPPVVAAPVAAPPMTATTDPDAADATAPGQARPAIAVPTAAPSASAAPSLPALPLPGLPLPPAPHAQQAAAPATPIPVLPPLPGSGAHGPTKAADPVAIPPSGGSPISPSGAEPPLLALPPLPAAVPAARQEGAAAPMDGAAPQRGGSATATGVGATPALVLPPLPQMPSAGGSGTHVPPLAIPVPQVPGTPDRVPEGRESVVTHDNSGRGNASELQRGLRGAVLPPVPVLPESPATAERRTPASSKTGGEAGEAVQREVLSQPVAGVPAMVGLAPPPVPGTAGETLNVPGSLPVDSKGPRARDPRGELAPGGEVFPILPPQVAPRGSAPTPETATVTADNSSGDTEADGGLASHQGARAAGQPAQSEAGEGKAEDLGAPCGTTPPLDPATLLGGREATSTRITGTDGLYTTSSDAEQLQHLIGQLLDGIRATIPDSEAETHYELGLTFLMMGRPEEAVPLFQRAYRAPGWRNRSAEALAQAFIAFERPALARKTVMTTLGALGADDADVPGLLYWQGRAEEALGHIEEAVDCYERVTLCDVSFQDAMARLRALRG